MPINLFREQMGRKAWSLLLVFSLYLFLGEPAYADESLAEVMARMKPDSAVKIHYRETRYLELLDKPWQGSGYLYVLSPDVLIKEQWYPQRQIMGASGWDLFYFDPFNDVRHHGEMQTDDPVSFHVLAFKALMNGDRELLQEFYQLEFNSDPVRWTLTLTAKQPSAQNTLAKIVITGAPGQVANNIKVFQADGDRSEFVLAREAEGEKLQTKVARLLTELQGE